MAKHLRIGLFTCLPSNVRNSTLCSGGQVWPRDWPNGREPSCSWPMAHSSPKWAASCQCNADILYKWIAALSPARGGWTSDGKRTGRKPVFSPRGRDASGQDRLRATG